MAFTYPLLISGSEQQLRRLEGKLRGIGYEGTSLVYSDKANILTTNIYDTAGAIGVTHISSTRNSTRYKLDAFQEELILALAAVNDNVGYVNGEIVAANTDFDYFSYREGNLARVRGSSQDSLYVQWLPNQKDKNGAELPVKNGSYVLNAFRKATPFEILKYYNMTDTKKIIGYKAPVALFGGDIPKGTVYVSRGQMYIPTTTQDGYGLPKEIVETWELVYEEEAIVIAGEKAEYLIGQVKFGCKTFTKQEVAAYMLLLNATPNTKITVDGQEITSKLLNRILDKL